MVANSFSLCVQLGECEEFSDVNENDVESKVVKRVQISELQLAHPTLKAMNARKSGAVHPNEPLIESRPY